MRRWFILGLMILGVLVALPSRAAAHANLARSDPAAGATLQIPPQELMLEFTEELDPAFSKVELLNSRQDVINSGPGVVDAAQPTILRLTLQGGLGTDTYTMRWRARSAVDGHVTEGNVPFGIGVEPVTVSVLPAPGTPDPATALPAVPDSLARWLVLLSAALAFGPLPFLLLVWDPVVRSASAAETNADDLSVALWATLRRLILLGCGLFLLANLFFLVVQAAQAARVSLGAALGAPLVALATGRSGLLILARSGLGLLLAGLAWWHPRRPAARWSWAGLLLAALAMLTISLGSHGAALAERRLLAIVMDWLHLLAFSVWIGGLLPLWLALRLIRSSAERAVPLLSIVARFSRLALRAVLLLILTGVYSSLVHIERPALALATTYGRALLIKLLLFGLLLGLGAINQFVFLPQLRKRTGRVLQRLSSSVRAELVTALLVLLAVGIMTGVAPSLTAWEAHEQLGLREEAKVGDVGLTLQVAPARVGDNEFAVDVADPRSGAQDVPSEVLLRFNMLDMAMGVVQTKTHTLDAQRYATRGNFLSMGGRWELEVVLRKAGFDDVRHTFALNLPLPPDLPAPLTPDPVAVERARPLFQANCLPCHGEQGKGDGPAARSLNPRPADLSAPHVDNHLDQQIYDWIADGFPGSAMPAFGTRLTEEQIWDLVHLVRQIRATARAQP